MIQRAAESECPRCKGPLTTASGEHAGACWWCDRMICHACWDQHGHCGHAGADAVNRQIKLSPYEQRRALVWVALGDPLSELPRQPGREAN